MNRRFRLTHSGPVPAQQTEPDQAVYREYHANAEGLRRGLGLLTWDRITALRAQTGVIAGYGNLTIEGRTPAGDRTALTVKSENTEAYRVFLAVILRYATSAHVDAALRRSARRTPAELRGDMLAIVLFLAGVVALTSAWWVIAWYAPTVFLSNVYPLLLLPLGGIPAVLALTALLSGAFGRPIASRWKMLAAGLMSGGAVAAVGVFLVLSPFSRDWMIADVHRRRGHRETAIARYQSALDRRPGSLDIHYDLGKLYRARQDWPRALEHLIAAYEADPAYWTASAVVQIPDTLLRMGRYDEAESWCRRIRGDLPGRPGIAEALNEMGARIRRARTGSVETIPR